MTEIIEDQTPPILQGPSDKEKKYDRQLRLWAANGQQALEDAHILLFNSGCGVVGVETLKNLVLPGIGSFTIIDDAKVQEEDLGVNFFLDETCLGKPRAECLVKFLMELNPDVKGYWGGSESYKDRLPQYTLIMYTVPADDVVLRDLEVLCQKNKIPLVAINSQGFYSYFSIQFSGNFPIVDTHPDSTATTDLRLLSPWLELAEFARELTADIEGLSAHEHGHIPYVALLLHYLEEWKSTHEGNMPQTYADKVAFRKMVAAGARTDNPEGGEENYDEATAAVLKTISLPTLPSSVKEVFDYQPDEIDSQSDFWTITDAVKQFHTHHGVLPLPGSVPDMKAQSEVYVRLQNIYKTKARKDVDEVLSTVRSLPNGAGIAREEVELYCKNAAFIKLIRESAPDRETLDEKIRKLADAELRDEFALQPSLFPIYLALRATETLARPPSHPAPDDLTASDILREISATVAPGADADERLVAVATEVARARGAELHNISALTGGMVAQEVIKLITRQYVPVDNVCVFDGVRSRTQVFRV